MHCRDNQSVRACRSISPENISLFIARESRFEVIPNGKNLSFFRVVHFNSCGKARICSAGMTLVEVALALGIAAIAIIIIIGLLPAGLSSSKEARSEQTATDILTEIEIEIRQSSIGQTTTPRLGISLPFQDDDQSEAYFTSYGLMTSSGAGDAVYRATITRRNPANPALEAWHIAVEWPVPAEVPQGFVETVVIRPNPAAL